MNHYLFQGPRTPLNLVPTTPEKSDEKSFDNLLDLLVEESTDEEDNGTIPEEKKVEIKEAHKPFRFKTTEELNTKKARYSPTSSPINLPSEGSDDTLIISSDEELEVSMIAIVDNLSQENF